MFDWLNEFGHYWFFVVNGAAILFGLCVLAIAATGAVGAGIFMLVGKLRG